jgi:NAD(P)-dependent dehydrogenase (short-subunit alcohol dehydrogenase family)
MTPPAAKKVAIVTGASQGVGAGVADGFWRSLGEDGANQARFEIVDVPRYHDPGRYLRGSEEPGSAVGVVDPPQLEPKSFRGLALSQVTDVRDVLDNRPGDPAAGIAQDDAVADLDPEESCGVGSRVTTGPTRDLTGATAPLGARC